MKRCSKCRKEYERPEGNFARDRKRKDGYYIVCKSCRKLYERKLVLDRRNRAERQRLYQRMVTKKLAEAHFGEHHLCAVLGCEKWAVAYLHMSLLVNAAIPLDLVALCENHIEDAAVSQKGVNRIHPLVKPQLTEEAIAKTEGRPFLVELLLRSLAEY